LSRPARGVTNPADQLTSRNLQAPRQERAD
jgi:hypothetical protein